jgi:hypothetical protein
MAGGSVMAGGWNYRMMRHIARISDASAEPIFGIHEVYYSDKDLICGWTKDPVEIYSNDPIALRKLLLDMLMATALPILDADAEPRADILEGESMEEIRKNAIPFDEFVEQLKNYDDSNDLIEVFFWSVPQNFEFTRNGDVFTKVAADEAKDALLGKHWLIEPDYPVQVTCRQMREHNMTAYDRQVPEELRLKDGGESSDSGDQKG